MQTNMTTNRSARVILKTPEGTWDVRAEMSHIENTTGIGPSGPGPHKPWVRILAAALSEALLENDTGSEELHIDVTAARAKNQ